MKIIIPKTVIFISVIFLMISCLENRENNSVLPLFDNNKINSRIIIEECPSLEYSQDEKKNILKELKKLYNNYSLDKGRVMKKKYLYTLFVYSDDYKYRITIEETESNEIYISYLVNSGGGNYYSYHGGNRIKKIVFKELNSVLKENCK